MENIGMICEHHIDGGCTSEEVCGYFSGSCIPSLCPYGGGYKAILSTTVLPLDGEYRVTTLSKGEMPFIVGCHHYIGHPDTKALVESFGAIPAKSKLFTGLKPGEQAVCFPIAQGKSNRATDGFTSPHQAISLDDLSIRIITRIK